MIAIIGDIHGCYYTLIDIHNLIKKKYPKVKIFSIGDLVDRGKNSFETVSFIQNERILFTPGNHDYMFIAYFKEPGSAFARSWMFNGNEATLKSYEKHPAQLNNHLRFLRSAPLFYNLPDCFISHAGISTEYKKYISGNFERDINLLEGIIYEDYKYDHGILWTREELINIGRLQIVGHTKYDVVTYDPNANVLYIDTGACMGYKLSAVIIDKEEVIDILDVKTNALDIESFMY